MLRGIRRTPLPDHAERVGGEARNRGNEGPQRGREVGWVHDLWHAHSRKGAEAGEGGAQGQHLLSCMCVFMCMCVCVCVCVCACLVFVDPSQSTLFRQEHNCTMRHSWSTRPSCLVLHVLISRLPRPGHQAVSLRHAPTSIPLPQLRGCPCPAAAHPLEGCCKAVAPPSTSKRPPGTSWTAPPSAAPACATAPSWPPLLQRHRGAAAAGLPPRAAPLSAEEGEWRCAVEEGRGIRSPTELFLLGVDDLATSSEPTPAQNTSPPSFSGETSTGSRGHCQEPLALAASAPLPACARRAPWPQHPRTPPSRTARTCRTGRGTPPRTPRPTSCGASRGGPGAGRLQWQYVGAMQAAQGKGLSRALLIPRTAACRGQGGTRAVRCGRHSLPQTTPHSSC